jgi:hypothetical protein
LKINNGKSEKINEINTKIQKFVSYWLLLGDNALVNLGHLADVIGAGAELHVLHFFL